MKISELTDDIVREFCGIDEESKLLPVFRAAALGFITGYTGLTAEEIDEHEDITQAYLVLINDMSCARDYTVSRDTVNPAVSAILGMYAKNYLTGV